MEAEPKDGNMKKKLVVNMLNGVQEEIACGT